MALGLFTLSDLALIEKSFALEFSSIALTGFDGLKTQTAIFKLVSYIEMLSDDCVASKEPTKEN